MSINLITLHKLTKDLVTVSLLLSVFVGQVVAEQKESLFNFKFNHLSNIQNNASVSAFQAVPAVNNTMVNFAQYDATLSYPWETKNMSIDLGVTLRHLSGFSAAADENLSNNYFQKTLPLIHASAVFSLPLKGLSAGIEGSRLNTTNHKIFDYRAKVSYEWRQGFGMQGGWQHQQFNLNNSSKLAADFEKKGPFIDFYLNF